MTDQNEAASPPEPPSPGILQTYWESQWRRNQEHEAQRLEVSNFVVAASVVGLGAAAGSDGSKWVVLAFSIAVVLANILAVGFSIRSGQWARVHKHRADIVLRENWPYFDYVQALTYSEKRPNRPYTPKPHDYDDPTRREMLQRFLHGVLVVAAAAIGLIAVLSPPDDPPQTVPVDITVSNATPTAPPTSASTSAAPTTSVP